MEKGVVTSSQEYASFRSTVPKRKIVVTHRRKDYTWCLYDHGPRDQSEAILFFPPVSCRSDVFYRQLIDLGSQGFRCIAVDYPVVWNIDDFCAITSLFLEHLEVTSVHIMGGSLGAFLGQKFAQFTYKTPIVKSLMLVNGFTDTSVFKNAPSPKILPFMPRFMLQQLLLQNMPDTALHPDVADSIDFVIEDLNTLSKSELASRLVLNVKESYVEPQHIFSQDIKIMIVEVNDKSALSTAVKDEMKKYYSDARICHLKYGGNFPYLSNSLEVNMFIKIHMRQFRPKTPQTEEATTASTTTSPITSMNPNIRSANPHSDGEDDEEDVTF
eukprot:m.200571 g.200571  ORF g.200571 m.200571 type:complete len:327 (+) comp13711_c0_seq5:123-1103(+)